MCLSVSFRFAVDALVREVCCMGIHASYTWDPRSLYYGMPVAPLYTISVGTSINDRIAYGSCIILFLSD